MRDLVNRATLKFHLISLGLQKLTGETGTVEAAISERPNSRMKNCKHPNYTVKQSYMFW